MAGILNILTPLGTNYYWLAICMFLCSIFHAFLDLCELPGATFLLMTKASFKTDCNMSILQIWGDKAVNYMQALHTCFGVGAMTAPLITRPFLLPHIYEDEVASSDGNIYQYSSEDVKIHYAFWIIGGYMILIAIAFIYYSIQDRRNAKSKAPDDTNRETKKPEVPRWKQYLLVVIVGMIAHVAFGVELIIANFAQAFGVKSDLRMPKKKSALLVTAFWICFSFFKLLFVPLAMYFGERRMVLVNMGIMLVSLAFLVPHAAYNEVCAWISFILLGIGYSPLFSVVYASLESYFPVNNRQTCIIFVMGTLGETLHLPLVGYLLNRNPYTFTYYLSIISFTFLVLMSFHSYICHLLLKPPEIQKLRPRALSEVSNAVSLAGLRNNLKSVN